MSRKERFGKLSELGCIVCRLHYGVFSQPAIHHLTGLKYRSTGKKADDQYTIGLCGNHHQHGSFDHPSIHTHPELFEQRYGTQESLLEITNKLIENN